MWWFVNINIFVNLPKMKLLIAGTRTFTDYMLLKESVCNYIRHINPIDITMIISGGANGADRLGELFAFKNKIPLKIFNADWKTHGKSAGPIRNALMAEYCDNAIIFWDGESKGTKNMIDNMNKVNKLHHVIYI